MSLKKISKEQPENFEFNPDNLKKAKKIIGEKIIRITKNK